MHEEEQGRAGQRLRIRSAAARVFGRILLCARGRGQSHRPFGRQRQRAVHAGRQPAPDHQFAPRDPQLAELFDRGRGNHPLRPAVQRVRGAEPGHHPESFFDPRHAAIERPRLPDQPERHRLRRRVGDRHRGSGGLEPQPVERGFSLRPPEFYLHARRGLGRQPGDDQRRKRRERLPRRSRCDEQRHHHKPERRSRPRCGQLGRARQSWYAQPAGRDHRAR